MKLFKFRDSKLIDSFEPDLIALEAKGLQGSKVLLEGKYLYYNLLISVHVFVRTPIAPPILNGFQLQRYLWTPCYSGSSKKIVSV